MYSSDSTSGTIRIYDGRGGDTPLETIETLHRFPVHIMSVSCFQNLSPCFQLIVIHSQYSDRYDTVVSADEGGFIEYWQPIEPFTLPKNIHGLWSYKSETDLYEFKKVSHCNISCVYDQLISAMNAVKSFTNMYHYIPRLI